MSPILGGGGGGGVAAQPTTTVQQNEVPEWVKREGEQLFKEAKPLTQRQYPDWNAGDRVAPFSADTMASFDLGRQNVGAWQPAYANSFNAAGNAATPVSQADIERYTNPWTTGVINSTVDDILRNSGREKVDRDANLAQRGSYLNEDRRAVIDNMANERTERTIASTVAGLQSQGFTNALQQANADKARSVSSSQAFANLAPAAQTLGYADASAMSGIGGAQELKSQQGLDIDYEKLMTEFYYPQNQSAFLTSIMSGIPYSTSTTTQGQQLYQKSNPYSSALGAASTIASMFF